MSWNSRKKHSTDYLYYGEDSRRRYALLKYFLEHKECVVDRETLISRIWGYDYEGNDRVVDNHIKKLRKAIGSSGKHIKTVVAKGYKMTEKI